MAPHWRIRENIDAGSTCNIWEGTYHVHSRPLFEKSYMTVKKLCSHLINQQHANWKCLHRSCNGCPYLGTIYNQRGGGESRVDRTSILFFHPLLSRLFLFLSLSLFPCLSRLPLWSIAVMHHQKRWICIRIRWGDHLLDPTNQMNLGKTNFKETNSKICC